MNNHICFESIDCEDLVYVSEGKCWVCMERFCEVKHVDTCMQCQFAARKRNEDRIRREKKRG